MPTFLRASTPTLTRLARVLNRSTLHSSWAKAKASEGLSSPKMLTMAATIAQTGIQSTSRGLRAPTSTSQLTRTGRRTTSTRLVPTMEKTTRMNSRKWTTGSRITISITSRMTTLTLTGSRFPPLMRSKTSSTRSHRLNSRKPRQMATKAR